DGVVGRLAVIRGRDAGGERPGDFLAMTCHGGGLTLCEPQLHAGAGKHGEDKYRGEPVHGRRVYRLSLHARQAFARPPARTPLTVRRPRAPAAPDTARRCET